MQRLLTNTMCLLMAVALAVGGNSVVSQMAAQKANPPAAKSSEVTGFFPLQVGNRWVYRIRGEQTGAGNHTVQVNSQFEETITAITPIGSVKLVEFRRDSSPDISLYCSPEESKDSRFWLIIEKNRTFSRCDKAEATKLARTLNDSPLAIKSDDHLEFVLPFRVGASWGADPDSPPREDGFYQWNVDDRDTSAAHQRFRDCYVLSYRTLPDDEERHVCAGVGLVSDDYNHHGTTNQYSIELVSFTRGVDKH